MSSKILLHSMKDRRKIIGMRIAMMMMMMMMIGFDAYENTMIIALMMVGL
jgi:hypothetical protein